MATANYPPLTNAKGQFFLLAIPYDQSSTFAPQRLRFHSPSHPIMVLTDDAPKFIRFHSQASTDAEIHNNILVATSWDARHKDRWWGVSLDSADGSTTNPRGCQEVHMLEGKFQSGFQWDATTETDRDELVYVRPSDSNNDNVWAGWVVCDGSLGFKQLFWTTSPFERDLPARNERVRIVRERVWGQPDTPKTPDGESS